MEDAARVTRLLLALLVAAPAVAAAEGPPTRELAAAVRSLGGPGLLWGRLAVEEESPDGPWTPLAGVQVAVSPYSADVMAELEQIRRGARDALRQHETAVARIVERLRRYRDEVDAARRDLVGASAGSGEDESLVQRRVTDSRGVFLFEDLPAGEWLVVAIRVTPYGTGTGSAGSRPAARPSQQRFLPRPAAAVKAAEVWAARVRVTAGERTRLLLSDRARFLVGPLAGDTSR